MVIVRLSSIPIEDRVLNLDLSTLSSEFVLEVNDLLVVWISNIYWSLKVNFKGIKTLIVLAFNGGIIRKTIYQILIQELFNNHSAICPIVSVGFNIS